MKKRSIVTEYKGKVVSMPAVLREINSFRLQSSCNPAYTLPEKKNGMFISSNLTGENLDNLLKKLGENLTLLD